MKAEAWMMACHLGWRRVMSAGDSGRCLGPKEKALSREAKGLWKGRSQLLGIALDEKERGRFEEGLEGL